MDKKKIVETLNLILENELAGVVRYTHYSLMIFGHTHKAVVVRDGARVALNPGAAGPRRFDLKPSVARLTITAGQPASVAAEIISLE